MELIGEKLLRIEYIPLARVEKWDKNPKRHDLPRLMDSIHKYGFRDAVIFDGTLGSLVAGHGRAAALEAIQNLGNPPPDGVALDSAGVWYIPVQFGNDAISRAVAEAFALDHNNLTVTGSGFDASLLWDAAGYADVLRGLADGFALPVTVSAAEAGRLLGYGEAVDAEPQIDKAAELAVKWGTKLGQIWELGAHRLAVGDCTDRATVEAVMRGERAQACVTDPPYNMEMGGGGMFASSTKNIKRRIDNIIDFNPDSIGSIIDLSPTWYIFCNKALIKAYLSLFNEWYYNILVWCKTNPVPFVDGTFLPDVEYIMWFGSKQRVWVNHISPTGTYSKYFISQKLEGRKDFDGEAPHPTIKPRELIERYIKISSNQQGVIFDPFLGSGTTLIAAQNLNRRCRAIELDIGYAAVTLQRFLDATHQEPRLV